MYKRQEYKSAAELFEVSYSQVYQWVKKYLELGEEGLKDSRGKRKEESQLNELEKLQYENERLKHQSELKEKNIILKKLKEANITQSMSRVGKCIDNGSAKRFWRIIKSEMYYLNKFNSFNELKKAIETHIDFYNNERFNNKVPMKVRLEALNGTENPAQYPTNNSLNYAMV